jgi:hypothetical protein
MNREPRLKRHLKPFETGGEKHGQAIEMLVPTRGFEPRTY